MPARSRFRQKLEFVISGVFMAARAFSGLVTGASSRACGLADSGSQRRRQWHRLHDLSFDIAVVRALHTSTGKSVEGQGSVGILIRKRADLVRMKQCG